MNFRSPTACAAGERRRSGPRRRHAGANRANDAARGQLRPRGVRQIGRHASVELGLGAPYAGWSARWSSKRRARAVVARGLGSQG
jgi:hypothetical protein